MTTVTGVVLNEAAFILLQVTLSRFCEKMKKKAASMSDPTHCVHTYSVRQWAVPVRLHHPQGLRGAHANISKHYLSCCCNKTMSQVDNQGRCSKHPFVQIKRRSRQGEWKALLDSCPLCAIDSGNTEDGCNSSISSSNSISEKEEHASVALIPADDDVSVRRTSKVKFASDNESPENNPYVMPLPASLLPPLRSDISISDGCGHSVASNNGSIASTRSALKESKYKVCQIKMQQHLNETENVTTMSMDLDIDEDSDDEEENLAVIQPPQPQPEPEPESEPAPELVEEEPIHHQEPRRKHHHGERRDRDSKSSKEKRRSKRHQIRNSLVQVSPDTNRPDPEEFPCGESLGSNHQEMPRPLRSPSYNSGPYTNVVVCPPTNFDDEVSAISFMESVKYQPLPNNRQHQDPIAEEKESIQDTTECINTNNYDKKGRCVNHPQIRLRKKKLFGRGWKVLMNACPDCCVDELRRFKSAEASKRRQPRPSSLEYPGGGSIRSAPLPHRDSSIKSISDETASLTASNDSSNSDRSAKYPRQERVDMHQTSPAVEAKEKKVIFVRQMQWTDERCNMGLYTGEVDSGFAPHGSGSLQYNDGTVLEGKWRHGEHRPKRRSRSSSRSRSSRSRSQSKTRVSSSGRSRSSSRSSVTRTRSRSVSVQPVASFR